MGISTLISTMISLVVAVSVSVSVSAQAQTLTVYTYNSFSGKYGPGGAVKERFEAACGCTLKWVAVEDAGTLLARL
ncbi:MAG: thiamine ABC transporter substrate-binding protein, partial [Planctomycetota bacterium]